MNKYVLLFFIFFNFDFLNALETPRISLEPRIGAFLPVENTFRGIYGTVGTSYELQGNLEYEQFSAWINTSWFQKKGKSIGFRDSTYISISGTSMGLSYFFPYIGSIRPYIGLGPNFSYIWLKDKSRCYSKKTSKFSLGGLLKIGFCIDIKQNGYLDIFADYLYQPVSFKVRRDIGGVKTGVGFGYRF